LFDEEMEPGDEWPRLKWNKELGSNDEKQ